VGARGAPARCTPSRTSQWDRPAAGVGRNGDDAPPFCRHAIERRVIVWETASVCPHGTAEELVTAAPPVRSTFRQTSSRTDYPWSLTGEYPCTGHTSWRCRLSTGMPAVVVVSRHVLSGDSTVRRTVTALLPPTAQ
jgi:hypothetical protein